jgi:hypothetical protein
MRSRFATIFITLFLAAALIGCSKQPSESSSGDTTKDNASAETAKENAPAAAETSAGGQKMKAEAPAPTVIPAGTTLTVRLGQAVGSKISQPGETFTATIAHPVQIGGKTVIPSGSSASGTVVDAKPLGKFKGGAELRVRLDSVNINGTDYTVETSSVTRTAKGKGKRTAVMAGGGAGVGALIGGLAGGGKGAAIGAIAGGGAGTAGAAFTGNKDIVLPAESALSFRLEQPLQVK